MAKEKVEDRIARSCIGVRVRMLSRAVSNLYDEALRPLGLKGSQLGLLVGTAKLGTARPAQVCDILRLDASTLSRNVERMQARGWLEVVPDEDGRAQPFRLTASGRALLDRAGPRWEEAQRAAAELIGEDGVRMLHQIEGRLGE